MKLDGFSGFIPVKEMPVSYDKITELPGVYVVLRESEDTPQFVETGSGGFFKGKNPNVEVSELKANYLNGCNILYIGKATNLKNRLKQLIRFGQGKAVGHWGGRYLWQLADAQNLIVAWMPTPGVDSRSVEIKMLEEFVQEFGALPFANLNK